MSSATRWSQSSWAEAGIQSYEAKLGAGHYCVHPTQWAKVLVTFVHVWKGGNAPGSPPMLGSVEGETPGPTNLIPGTLPGSVSP